MKVAIIGGWKAGTKKWSGFFGRFGREQYSLNERLKSEFPSFCRLIGQGIAAQRHAVIVGGDKEYTADYHVVDGIRREAPNDTIAKMAAVRRAGAVITIAGLEATHLAGAAAFGMNKRLVPVGSFGGGSAELIQMLERHGDGAVPTDQLALHPSEELAQTALRLAGVFDPPRLLIIHGHSPDRDELGKWLESEGLATSVQMIHDLPEGLEALPEKFERLAERVDGAVAIATPDDVGHALQTPDVIETRARQNVWIEVGWVWGSLGRDRIVILQKGDDLSIPSDLAGIETLGYEGSPTGDTDLLGKLRRSIDRLQHRA